MKKNYIETPTRTPDVEYDKPAYKFDKYDRLIIKELDENSRKPLSYLSKKVGLSRDAVRNRIEKMIKAKVIAAFKPIYNAPSVGYPIVNYIFITINASSEEEEKKFIKYMINEKHVTYMGSLIGKWDYSIEILSRDQGEFERVFKKIRHKFYDIIKDYESYGLLQEYKHEEIGRLVYE